MNLTVDIGNTSVKFAVFDRKNKLKVFRSPETSDNKLRDILSDFHIDKVIVSSVKEIPGFVNELLSKVSLVHILSTTTKLPFSNTYRTPETLGPDRLAAVAGAYYNFPGADILVIDAGSAITYDFLTGDIYRGGNISPGMSMRFRSLNQFTGKLPLVNPVKEYSFPGTDTTDAIAAGVISGMIYEINEYIRTFEKNHTDARIILTGGDGVFFMDKLHRQLLYMPDLVMEGLNFILEYNAK